MNILCNGEPIALDENIAVLVLMRQRELLEKKGITVAVNNTIIRKNEWDEYMLQEADNILIINTV